MSYVWSLGAERILEIAEYWNTLRKDMLNSSDA